ncbi:MAG: hypothetical protein EOM62_19300 [Bacteroidia bacterium]|nr:hypothetical protein [Bacteroidia bacterium]
MSAALLTKGFLILGGVSGVGKTHMARTFSSCVASIANGGESATIPVSPSWTDETYVTGYWNPLTSTWETSQYLDLMKKAANSDRPFFAIFDEMNIARPEYYMPNLLSIMEIRGSEGDESKDGTISIKEKRFRSSMNALDRTVPLSHNMFIVGTANTDESTFNFSPKVIDRAFYFKYTADDIELVSPWDGEDNTEILDKLAYKFKERMDELGEKTCSPRLQNQGYQNDGWERKLWEELKTLLNEINKTDPDPDSPVAFGTRCINEMAAFIVNYIQLADDKASSYDTHTKSHYFKEAFDWAVRTKMLPKFSGSESQLSGKIDKTIDKVGEILGEDKWASVDQLKNVKNKMKADGFYIY